MLTDTGLFIGAFVVVAASALASGSAYELTVLAFLGAAVVAGATLWATRRHRLRFTWLDALVSAFGAWLLVSMLNSEAISHSANTSLRLSLLFFGYVIARRMAPSPRPLLGAIGVTALVAAAAVTGSHLAFDVHLGGPFTYQHMFAIAAVAAIFLGMGAVSSATRAGLVLCAIAGFAVFLLVGLTGSRGVLLASSAGFAAAAILVTRADRTNLASLCVGALAGIGGAALLTAGGFTARIASLADPMIAGRSRFMLWESVLPIIESSPALGFGPGMLYLVWPPYRNPLDTTAGQFAHNSFLDIAVVAGIPGALLLTAIFAVALLSALRLRGAAHIVWPAAALCALLTHALVDFTLLVSTNLLLFGVATGLLASAAPALSITMSRMLGRWALVFGTVITIGLTIYGSTSLAGYYHQRAAEDAFAAGNAGPAFEHLTKSIKWWPASDLPRIQRAHIIAVAVLEDSDVATNPMAQQALAMARADAAHARRLNPYRVNAYTTSARVALSGHAAGLHDTGRRDAEAFLREAIARNPRSISARTSLATLLEERGEACTALRVLMAGMGYRHHPTDALTVYRAAARRLAEQLADAEALATIPEQ